MAFGGFGLHEFYAFSLFFAWAPFSLLGIDPDYRTHS